MLVSSGVWFETGVVRVIFGSLPTSTAVAREGTVFTGVCLCACFPHDISNTDAASITKLGILMLHGESRRPIYFGIKISSVKVKSHKNSAGMRLRTLVSAGFF